MTTKNKNVVIFFSKKIAKINWKNAEKNQKWKIYLRQKPDNK